jgi:hypothetical protein
MSQQENTQGQVHEFVQRERGLFEIASIWWTPDYA